MNSDDDILPTEELRKRKISQALSESMEGLLTTEEITHALMNSLKGDSNPGEDGLTVNHLKIFWYDLKTITRDAWNCSFEHTKLYTHESSMSSSCRKNRRTPDYKPISLLKIF